MSYLSLNISFWMQGRMFILTKDTCDCTAVTGAT